MDSQDVRMVQRRNRARFLFETPQSVGIMCQCLWQHFDRDITPEPRVAGAVHLAHAARAQWSEDFIWPEFGASGECHSVGVNYSLCGTLHSEATTLGGLSATRKLFPMLALAEPVGGWRF
jgi:hypothetical protein